MKHLKSYLNSTINIDESLNNNVRMINESQLIIEHGKDIDNLLQKFGQYTYNSLYNPVNEASYNYKLTLDESITARDFFIFICEDYKEVLLEELNIYKQYINDTLEINEGFKNSKVYQNVVNVLKKGKEKTLQAYNNTKEKIKDISQIIKDFANKTIKSVKEMANRLMELLEKFNCTIKQLFEKMGFNVKDEEIDAIGQDLAKNPDAIKGNDIYDFKSETANESFEAYGQQLINEDKNDEETVDQVEYKGGLFGKKKLKDGKILGKINVTAKTKEMLWSAFRQFLIWASVCVVIPGVVCAVFPGTFIALLVPLACKLAWNGYKMVKLWKQWQKVRNEWGNYKKGQKWITVIGMVASIIAIGFNFHSSFVDGGKVLSAFTKTGGDLLAKAELGVQPDILTRGFAAFTKMISERKFSFTDFSSSFKEITNAFAEKTDLGAGIGASAIEKSIKASGKLGQTAEEAAEKIKEINDATHGSSIAELKAIEKISIGVDKIKDAPDNTMVDLVVNGTKESSYGKHLISFLKKTGIDTSTNDFLNKSLQKLNKLAGSVYTIKVPKDEALEILNNSAKYAKDGFIYAVSATAEEVTNNIPEMIKAATSMLATIPSVEYAFKNNGGFQIRLGTDRKKYVYEVGKDGVKKEKAKDHVKELEKITNILKETNNKNYKDLLEKSQEEEKEKLKALKEKIDDKIKNINKDDGSKVIVFYGHHTEIKENNEYLKSLRDYLINEAEEDTKKPKYSIDDIKDNFKDLRDYLNKIRYDKEQKGGGNNYMLITSIFNTNSNKPTSKFKFNKNYPKDPKKPYELIQKRSTDKDETNDVFGPNDIELLAKNFDEWIGSGNAKAYGYLTSVFIDALALRAAFMNNKDEDTIIAEYSEMVNNLLKIKYINDDVKDKKWIKGKQWAPLKFDEDQIDDEIVQKINDTEKNSGVEPSKDEAERKLKKTEAPVTQDTNDSNEESEESNDNGEKPILMIAYDYVIDLSNSDENGPRKDVFTLKGISDNYEFIEIEGGTSKENISIMLGDILNKQTDHLIHFTISPPCDNKDSDKYKTIDNENAKREDFGNLTNGEITDILNNPKSAKNYIFNGSSNSIAQNDKEKKQEEEFKKEYNDKLKNANEETIKAVKEIDPDAVGDDGKIKEKNIKNLSQDLATIKLGQNKANKGGVMSWLKNMFKKIFPNKKKNEKLKKLKEILDKNDIKQDHNNLNKYDDINIFFKEVFSPKTLSEYIMERKL